MTPAAESARARRYLLGHASDEESIVLEQEYLADDDAVERIAAAEDDLIENYLAGTLDGADRARFEAHYLSAPQHRLRVETIQRLMAQGGAMSAGSGGATVLRPVRWRQPRHWLALAASLLLVASVAFMLSRRGDNSQPSLADSSATPTQAPVPIVPPETRPPASSPRFFAVSISPVAVRSGADSPTITIPAGTDVVAIRLERDDTRTLAARRATIRTVAGREVWQGPARTDESAPPTIAARIEVPATAVPPDDYLVTLYGTTQAGVEMEWSQYFLRVRGQ